MYHLYTQRLYSLFDDFEMSEVKRQPMTEVALRLKSMLRGNEMSEDREESIIANPGAESGGDGVRAGVEEKAKQEKASESAQSTDSVGPSEADAQLVGDERNEVTSAAALASTASPITMSITDIPVTTNKPSYVATPPLLPSVTSVLLSLIEPPSLHSIHAALHTLHSYGMLTSSAEHSKLTEIGTLAADLPVDFMLGRFIGYAGIHFSLSILTCVDCTAKSKSQIAHMISLLLLNCIKTQCCSGCVGRQWWWRPHWAIPSPCSAPPTPSCRPTRMSLTGMSCLNNCYHMLILLIC